MKFRQHIPNFVSGGTPEEIHFENADDLFAHELFKSYMVDKFSHFAINHRAIIAVLDDGFEWWVVGVVDTSDNLGLPTWDGWKFFVEFPDGTRRIVGEDEVVSCCGDEIELRNRMICKKVPRN